MASWIWSSISFCLRVSSFNASSVRSAWVVQHRQHQQRVATAAATLFLFAFTCVLPQSTEGWVRRGVVHV